MTSRWGIRFAVVFAVSSGWAYAQVPDSVKLANENGTEESGVIAWGKEGMLDAMGVSPVSVGALSLGEANQVVAFTIDRPPALDANVPWAASSDIIPLDYPTPYKMPIKVWVLCVDDDCTTAMPASKKTELDGFLVWWNERFLAEHVGITLDGGADWIVDKTGLTGTGSSMFWDFDTTASCAKLVATARGLDMRQEGAFNVYMVRTVNGLSRMGNFCYTHDSAVVGSYALKGTILHEICHDLGLWHIDGKRWEKKVGGTKNLMSGDSVKRKFLTEGQVFRIHFTSNSGLHFELSASLSPTVPTTPPQERTPRDCTDDGPPRLPCPPEETMLWKDR
jgi:hypothetical protein